MHISDRDFSYLHIVFSVCASPSVVFLYCSPFILTLCGSRRIRNRAVVDGYWLWGEVCANPQRIKRTKQWLNTVMQLTAAYKEKAFEMGFCQTLLFTRLNKPLTFSCYWAELSFFIYTNVLVFVCVCLSSGIAPNITAGPSDSTVIDGMSIILHCETSGAPRPAITWQKGVCYTYAPSHLGIMVFVIYYTWDRSLLWLNK